MAVNKAALHKQFEGLALSAERSLLLDTYMGAGVAPGDRALAACDRRDVSDAGKQSARARALTRWLQCSPRGGLYSDTPDGERLSLWASEVMAPARSLQHKHGRHLGLAVARAALADARAQRIKKNVSGVLQHAGNASRALYTQRAAAWHAKAERVERLASELAAKGDAAGAAEARRRREAYARAASAALVEEKRVHDAVTVRANAVSSPHSRAPQWSVREAWERARRTARAKDSRTAQLHESRAAACAAHLAAARLGCDAESLRVHTNVVWRVSDGTNKREADAVVTRVGERGEEVAVLVVEAKSYVCDLSAGAYQVRDRLVEGVPMTEDGATRFDVPEGTPVAVVVPEAPGGPVPGQSVFFLPLKVKDIAWDIAAMDAAEEEAGAAPRGDRTHPEALVAMLDGEGLRNVEHPAVWAQEHPEQLAVISETAPESQQVAENRVYHFTLGLACDLHCQWGEYKTKYGKTYTAAEDAHRFAVFASNVERIERLNRQGSAKFAIGKFSDLTPEEFSAMHTGLVGSAPRGGQLPESVRMRRADIPSSYFHPSVTPVRNQRTCGSCWTFAAMGVLEATYKSVTRQTKQFSTQQLVDCAKRGYNGMGGGCQGGNYQQAFDYLKQHSAALEASYQYTARNGYCQEKDNGVTKITSWNYIEWEDETQIMSAVMTYGPIGVCLNGAQISDYSSGVLSTTDGTCSSKVDHAVVLVGWTTIDGVPAWIIKNSWGQDWGLSPVGWNGNTNGFMYVKRGQDGCGITQWPAAYIQQIDATPSGGAASSGASQCTPKSASQVCPAGARCGTVSDGCSGQVSCGSCSGGYSCQNFQCQKQCTPKDPTAECQRLGWQCGKADLGCNYVANCGDCGRSGGDWWGNGGTQQVRRNGQCVDPQPQCTPKEVCAGKQCGTYDDGCGQRVQCGTCSSGSTCDNGQCTSACKPTNTCSANGFTCGMISDGCDGAVSCGSCDNGQRCVNNKCEAKPASCTRLTRQQACGSAQCGATVDDGCGGSIDCGKCSAGFFCQNGKCAAARCQPKAPEQACQAGWECGYTSDGCGNSLQCGAASGMCPAGSSCSAHKCVPMSTDNDWVQVAPAGSSNSGFSVEQTQGVQGSTKITSTSDAEKRIKWVSSERWSRAAYVAYSYIVKATGPATLGIGARYGKQPYGEADCVFWKLTIDANNNAEFRQYSVLQGNEKMAVSRNGPFGVAFQWDPQAEHNLTVTFQDDGSKIVMVPLLDKAGIYNGQWTNQGTTSFSQTPSKYWSNTGAGFIVLAGQQAYMRTAGTGEALVTRSTVSLEFDRCTTEANVRNYVKRTCQIGDDAIEGIAPTTPCSGGNAKVFAVTFRDSRDAKNLGGEVVGFISAGTPNFQYSAELADTLVSQINTGNPAAAGFPATSAAVVASPALATTAAVTATAAAAAAGGGGLGAGAIVGIVIGSVAGAALLAAGVGTAVYFARLPEPAEPMPTDFQPRNPFRKTAYKMKAKKGVDVINMDKDHRSITARAPPIA
eukprot:m51a1_g6821 hypothetical protein (1494) ;mRNA; r:8266-14656